MKVWEMWLAFIYKPALLLILIQLLLFNVATSHQSAPEPELICEAEEVPPCTERIILPEAPSPPVTPLTTTTAVPDLCPSCESVCDEERSRCDLSEIRLETTSVLDLQDLLERGGLRGENSTGNKTTEGSGSGHDLTSEKTTAEDGARGHFTGHTEDRHDMSSEKTTNKGGARGHFTGHTQERHDVFRHGHDAWKPRILYDVLKPGRPYSASRQGLRMFSDRLVYRGHGQRDRNHVHQHRAGHLNFGNMFNM